MPPAPTPSLLDGCANGPRASRACSPMDPGAGSGGAARQDPPRRAPRGGHPPFVPRGLRASLGRAAVGGASIVQAFRRAGASETRVATAAAEREALWSLRHAASPTLARLNDRLKSMQFIEDAAVPPECLGKYVAGVRAALDGHRIP